MITYMTETQILFWILLPLLIKTIFSTSGQFVNKLRKSAVIIEQNVIINGELGDTHEYLVDQNTRIKYQKQDDILTGLNIFSHVILFFYFGYILGLIGAVLYFFILGAIPLFLGVIALKISDNGGLLNWYKAISLFPVRVAIVFTTLLLVNIYLFIDSGKPSFYFDFIFQTN
jgi:hypothetical protein